MLVVLVIVLIVAAVAWLVIVSPLDRHDPPLDRHDPPLDRHGSPIRAIRMYPPSPQDAAVSQKAALRAFVEESKERRHVCRTTLQRPQSHMQRNDAASRVVLEPRPESMR